MVHDAVGHRLATPPSRKLLAGFDFSETPFSGTIRAENLLPSWIRNQGGGFSK
jgi:hypothetical protein